MKKYISKAFVILPMCLLFTGCASIIHGTRQKIAVASNPPGATVSDGITTVQAPGEIELKRNRDYILTISKPGYESQTVQITHVISGAVAGNIIAGGPIGWGIDAISGAQWRLVPETISVNLRPLKEGEVSVGPKAVAQSTLESKLMELDSLRQKNLITDDEYKAMRELTIQSFKNEPVKA